MVETWGKKHFGYADLVAVLRRVRKTGDVKARLTIHLYPENKGKRDTTCFYLLTVYLKYHDGFWTAMRCEWSSRVEDKWLGAGRFLMDAIDEAAEQK